MMWHDDDFCHLPFAFHVIHDWSDVQGRLKQKTTFCLPLQTTISHVEIPGSLMFFHESHGIFLPP